MSTHKSTSEIDNNDFHAPVSMQTNVTEDNGYIKSQQYNNKIDKDNSHQIIQGDKNTINNITIKVDKDDSIAGASEKIANPKEEIEIEFIITGSLKKTIDKRKLKAIEKHLQKIADDVELTIVDVDEGSLKFFLKGSPEGLKRIAESFNSGELTEIFDVPIESVEFIEPEKEKLAFTITGDISYTDVAKLKTAVTGVDEKEILIRKIRTNQGEKKLNLSRANLSGAKLSGAKLSGAKLSGAKLSGAYLIQANLSDASLIQANLSDTSLIRANLRGTNFIKANFFKADLRNADLIRAKLREADLSKAYLSGANLSGANLSGANLSGTFLFVAKLIGANFFKADLSGAKLREADLSRANFSGANLSGADLSGVNLSGAKLKDSEVTHTKFSSNSPGMTEELKRNLIKRGAIFEDCLEDPLTLTPIGD
ncbi:MAG: pentapeptide repeat-containing protein [Okeania sp. SIO2F4]|uniref:pentapeptide repeat-containing protein n=1 Tax=Okeania sp. SIO2F4 TaxID=2607790 RepID=UPI00142ACF96|nr:pentapeptide repeat-containing protein [Okeania sp. SIO2F4]NES04743.1 pentapeptide repeat-containing protein [Okeania sp. SIO2F4]